LNFENVKLAPSSPSPPTSPTPNPPTAGPGDYTVTSGSGDYTVTYRAGNVVLTDNVLGIVRDKPLTAINSLTITAPDGRPGSLTIDESGGTFSLPGGIHFVGSASDPNQVTLIAGPGNDAIGISAAGATLNGQPIVTWTNLDQLRVVGGDGTDQFRVSGDPQARGLITLVGGPGSNVYQLAAVGAKLAVVDSTNHAVLDFHDASASVSIDLRLAQGQPQAIGAGGNTLSLYGEIADLTGTPYDDVIHGNELENIIRGLGGNDVIVAGTGNSILIGGGGDDILIAGPGRDILIGGTGRDILIADEPKRGKGDPQGGSILVAGATAYDANDVALEAIMAEWTSRRSRTTRAHNLLNGRGSRHRLNGSVFLNAKTIKSDHTADTIVGHNRYDWFRLGRGNNKPYLPLRD
jgi:Ca2+-binding RTX toxin-like protein